MMQRLTQIFAAALLLAAPTFAGGFWLTLGNPDASPEAQALHAVVTVMPTGCGDPANAKVTATAEGMIQGKRTTIALKISPLSRPGLYAITRQWPAEGKWAVRVVAEYSGATTSALIPIRAEGADRRAAKYQQGNPAEKDVAALLASN